MEKGSKKQNIIRIRKRLIIVLIIILSSTLIISFGNYKKTTKKIAVKESIRKLILTAEAVEINEEIVLAGTDTILNIKSKSGDLLKSIEKYSNIDDFNNIESLTLEDARKIQNDDVDFEINREGNFVNIK